MMKMKRYHVFGRKKENFDVKKTYLKNRSDFSNFATINYVLFVAGTENVARPRRAVSELWRRNKSGGV